MKAAIRITCLCLCITAPAYAGELSDYEGGASTPPPQDKKPQQSHDSGNSGGGGVRVYNGDDDDDFDAIDLITRLFVVGTQNSMQRMFNGSQDGVVEARHKGEPMLPLLRYDNYFSYMNANQYSIDQRLEVGWGPFGYEYRRTNFTEYSPATKLRWEQWNFLYRLTFGNNVGVNYGFGNSTLTGSGVNYGSNGVFQFFIHGQRLGIEYRGVATNFDSGSYSHDDDYTLMLHMGMASLSVGYRRLEDPATILSGYYVGYSLRL